ncbi:MAG TPA: D-tyrosyl-tRNA(Tyr) deacylase [Bacteroidetes bacterium]|nr:D-tyrosyl-tRNA(Tyr) deacylase [Bacteroidota bacterium]
MRAVIQRCKKAKLFIDNKEFSSIGNGLVVYIGIATDDNISDIEWMSGKISRMRIFNDLEGKMNLSIKEVKGELLIVSQFTLFASTKKGNRPSYIKSATPEVAIPIYEKFIEQIKHDSGLKVATGKFGAFMEVEYINEGPVTIIIDSKNKE